MHVGNENDPTVQWNRASTSGKKESKGKEKEEVENPSQRNVVSPETAEKTQKWAKGALREYKNEFVDEKDAIEFRLNFLQQGIERLSQDVAKQKPREGVFTNYPEQNDRRQLEDYKKEYHLLDSKLKVMEGNAQIGSSQLQKRSWTTKLADSKFGQFVTGAFKKIGNAFDRSSIENKEKRLNFIQEKVRNIRSSGSDSEKALRTLTLFSLELGKMINDDTNMKLKLNKDDKDYDAKLARINKLMENATELRKDIHIITG